MKKFFKVLLIIILIFGAAVGGYILYHKIFGNSSDTDAFNVIPDEAFFVVEADNVSKAWSNIAGSELWEYLQTTPYFADVNQDIDLLNKFLKDNAIADKILSDRKILVSGCLCNSGWDLLYVVDLQQFSGYFNDLKKCLGLVKGFTLTKKSIQVPDKLINQEIYILTSNSDPSLTICIAPLDNILAISLNCELLETAVKKSTCDYWNSNHNFKMVNASLTDRKMFKFYVNYNNLNKFYSLFSTDKNDIVDMLDKSLTFSAMELDLEGNKLSFDGYTALDSLYSYVKAFANVGPGKLRGFDIASQQTAAYISLSFDDFNRFYNSFLDEYKKGNAADAEEMQRMLNLGQKLLGVDISQDFLGWIGNEIVMCKLRPMSDDERDIDMAILVHAGDINNAKAGLGKIIKHIRRRTPLKFDIEPYRNFEINYLEMKGFFKMFFGNLFQNIEKPYFTYIENYVVFANSQEVLKQIIDDYITGKTLSHDPKFVDFKDDFDAKSNISVFIQMPKMYHTLYKYSHSQDKEGIEKNKDLIYSFARIGFQLTNDGGMFKTSLCAEYDASARSEDETQKVENISVGDPLLASIDSCGIKIILTPQMASSDGMKRTYYPDSTTVFQEGNVIGGKCQGLWRTYYDDGTLQSAVNYQNGMIQGLAYFYYDTRDKIMAEINYDNDKIEGDYLLYYENGSRKAKIEYEDGVKSGKAEFYHPNGNLRMTCKYRNGQLAGKATVYDEKGNQIGKQKTDQ